MADDSKASNVGDRYALALFDLAREQNQLPTVEADLKSLKTMLAESRDLRILLHSPAFGGADKAKGLAAVASAASLSPTTRKFLGLLSANGRAGLLESVIT
ncbi:MAG TPA: F0F1 ATP synthase subunit delta, partial [Phenylobacterium sp.]